MCQTFKILIIYFKNFFYEFKINKKNYIINIKNIKKINLIYIDKNQ